MSLKKIHLRKLLAIFYLPQNQRTAMLRADIRLEIQKENKLDDGGGDFHAPFWTDAKNHVAGRLDLREQLKIRIRSNKGRARLYPLLTDGFLTWWNEKRRWRNEPFEFMAQSVKAQFFIPEVDSVVKVENLLALNGEGQFKRIIYPYFSEQPALTEEGGRLGLWLLKEALTKYQSSDLRLLDILRGASFATLDFPLRGSERDLFLQKYEQVLREWNTLRKDYE